MVLILFGLDENEQALGTLKKWTHMMTEEAKFGERFPL